MKITIELPTEENAERLISAHQRKDPELARFLAPLVLVEQIKKLPKTPETLFQRIELCRQALAQVDRESQSMLWAQLHVELGLRLHQISNADRARHLEEAIEHFETALTVYTRHDHAEFWAATTHNLAVIYAERIHGNRTENLEKATRLYDQALEVRTKDVFPEDWAETQHNLANVYVQRIEGDRAENLDRAIDLYRNALRVWTRDKYPFGWAQAQKSLGTAYFLRVRGRRSDNLRTAISFFEDALTVWTRQRHPLGWAEIQDGLGLAWRDYAGDDPAANLERAIACHQATLEIWTPTSHPWERARAQHNLGTAWRSRLQGSHAENVERAIECFQQALTVRTQQADPEAWAETTHNLATAYSERFTADSLEESKKLFEQILEEHQASPLAWARTQSELGNAYSRRIRGERVTNLEQAIECYNQALEVQSLETCPHDWARTHQNLAVAYSERLIKSRVNNLRKAVEHYEQALQVFDRQMPIQWATVQTDLADTYWKLGNLERSSHPEQAADYLDWAVSLCLEVVKALDKLPLSARSALAHYNLGNAYGDRIRGDRGENQERAIEHYSQALGFYTDRNYPARWADTYNNLGVTYWERICGNHASNIERAIDHFNKALEICKPDAFPVSARRVARNLGNLYFEEQCWQEAIAPYRHALQSSENLYQASRLRKSKEVELAETADLYHRAAYTLAHSGDLEEAVVTLERGRARLLSEALERDRADLEALKSPHPNLYERYRQATSQIADLMREELNRETLSPVVDLAGKMRAAYENLNQVVEAIRQVPGYADFLAQPDFDDVAEAIQVDMPLVYLVVTPAGGLALVVHHKGVEEIWLDNLTDEVLLERVQRWFDVYTAHRQARRAYEQAKRRAATLKIAESEELEPMRSLLTSARQAWFAVLEDTTCWLWDVLMGRLVAALQKLGYCHATLIPTGLLAFLPLHAAWHPEDDGSSRHYALDEVAFAYAPSARALTHARRIATDVPGKTLFAVDNPDGSLHYAAQEVSTVARHFSKPWVVDHERATRNTALNALPQYDLYHFACHGNNNWQNPLESALWMFGQVPLTVGDLLKLEERLQGRLAFLSACETGLIGTELPDEVVGLAAGFIQAGTAGVVSTLWAVDDESTALLAERFYENWKGQVNFHIQGSACLKKLAERFYENWKGQGTSPLEALVAAQRWLRDEADGGRWAHPYYWAAFTLTGV